LAASPRLYASAAAAFVPSEYRDSLERAHAEGASEHVLTVQKITSQLENLNTGKISVNSVTQLLDCKSGKLLSQSRCDPCEYNMAEWPKRPVDRWFTEHAFPQGATVARAQVEAQMNHFTRYFKLEKADGVEHQGFTYLFWSFDGRRGTPLIDPSATQAASGIKDQASTKVKDERKVEFGPVQKIEIFNGPNRLDVVDYPTDGRSLQLSAVAYAAPLGQSILSQVDSFSPMWSSSCGELSSKSAKQIVFTLKAGVDRCALHLYEGRTGREASVTVQRIQVKPKTRVAITFEGGRDAEGVALTGNIRSVQLEAHAFNPEGQELPNFSPEWDIEGGQVEFLDGDARRKLKVHLDKNSSRCEVSLRDKESGAVDHFLIESR